MLPFLHAVVDEYGDVLSTHKFYSEAVEVRDNAGDDLGVLPLYEISCFDLLEAVLWNNHKQVWEVRARGSSTYHKARLLREAVGLAVAEVASAVAAPAAEEDVLW